VKRQIIALSITVFAVIALSSLVSLMVIFMGGGQAGPDLHGLMLMQACAIPLALVAVGFVIALFVAASGWMQGLSRLWAAMPQWLVFGVVLLNSLFLAGELALVIVARAMGKGLSLSEQVPLVCLLLSTLAVLSLAAWAYDGDNSVLSGRWSPPHDENREWPDDY
jgi:hypothetical protein